jgi:hypothetical protein
MPSPKQAEMFYFLVESCTEVLSIDHAGLMLVDAAGNLQVVAATSEVTHLIELLQIQNQEGPCLDAFRSGLVVESGPLTDPEVRARWPNFSEAAHDAGFGAITHCPCGCEIRSRVRSTCSGSRASH